PFSKALETAETQMPSKRGVETGEACPKCGRPLVVNYSKKTRREFVGCSGFSDKDNPCKYIKPGEGEEARPEPELTDVLCPACRKPMLKRMGRTGPFLGCSGYPECKTTMNFDAEGKPVLSAKPTEHTRTRDGRSGPRARGSRSVSDATRTPHDQKHTGGRGGRRPGDGGRARGHGREARFAGLDQAPSPPPLHSPVDSSSAHQSLP